MSTVPTTAAPAAARVVRRRDGKVVAFRPQKIQQAVRLALLVGCRKNLDDEATARLATVVANHVEASLPTSGEVLVAHVEEAIHGSLVALAEHEAAGAFQSYLLARRELKREKGGAGLVRRHYTKEGEDVFARFQYRQYRCKIVHHVTGEVRRDMTAEVPAQWGDRAAKVLIDKYLRKAGVPSVTVPRAEGPEASNVPEWLRPRVAFPGAMLGAETSVKQVVHRIAGTWTYEGLVAGYFDPTEAEIKVFMSPVPTNVDTDPATIHRELRNRTARAFYDEHCYFLLAQLAAPNSPQWFNTGLWWAYGLDGSADGRWFVDLPADTRKVEFGKGTLVEHNTRLSARLAPSPGSYRRMQIHACYILSVDDKLVSPTGITGWWETEARIFQHGSGAGVNVSTLRGKGEPLSGGGYSSGPMSFVKVADAGGGAIKSGGVTRRCAKLVCMDIDHPDVTEFVQTKTDSESMVGAMVCGSQRIKKRLDVLMAAVPVGGDPWATPAVLAAAKAALADDVPGNYVRDAVLLAQQGTTTWPGKVFDAEFEGDAYANVPHQHANYSVRLTQDFYDAVDAGTPWASIGRVSGKEFSQMPAAELERMIATKAWACGDPGVMYHDNINDWNTSTTDGEINGANPCIEFNHLDNTACNLASQRLTAFLREDGTIDVEAMLHVTHLYMIAMDISVTMSHLPHQRIALNVYNFRDTGWGYCDLGALLMSLGLAYDSDGGRAVAGVLTALAHAQCELTSAKLAERMGAYPRFEPNRKHRLRTVRNHVAALDPVVPFEGITNPPERLNLKRLTDVLGAHGGFLYAVATDTMQRALEAGETHGFRNAQLSLIAPTGTISFVMGADTTALEPMLSFLITKTLAGGGTMRIEPATCVAAALSRLNYPVAAANQVVKAMGQAATDAEAIDALYTVLRPEHHGVFDTSFANPRTGKSISWQAHVKMVAAVQPFLSGACSKTINMPADATIDDIAKAYRLGNDLGLKSMALYRDGSKLSQPLSSTGSTALPAELLIPVDDSPRQSPSLLPAVRMKLPTERKPGIDVCVAFGEGRLYLRTSCYLDGKTGEVWATFTGPRGTGSVQDVLDQACKAANIGLQFGVPLSFYVRSWQDSVYEPRGVVSGHPYVKFASSVTNLMARLLDWHVLGNTDLLNVKPAAGPDPSTPSDRRDTADPSQETITTGRRCPDCGSAKLKKTGTCYACAECGQSVGGCG